MTDPIKAMTPTKFVEVPTLRGIHEIKQLFPMIWRLGVICGGYARYCLSTAREPAKPGDLDIYCFSDLNYAALREIMVANNFVKGHETKFAVEMVPNSNAQYYGPMIQLIKPVLDGRIVAVGQIDDILTNFDFTVTRAALISENVGYVDEDFIRDEREQNLIIKNIHCPISSSLRFIKYARKGYKATSFEIYKLFLDWDNRSPEYKSGLTEMFGKIAQLTDELKRLEDQDQQVVSGKRRDEIGKALETNLQSLYEKLNID